MNERQINEAIKLCQERMDAFWRDINGPGLAPIVPIQTPDLDKALCGLGEEEYEPSKLWACGIGTRSEAARATFSPHLGRFESEADALAAQAWYVHNCPDRVVVTSPPKAQSLQACIETARKYGCVAIAVHGPVPITGYAKYMIHV